MNYVRRLIIAVVVMAFITCAWYGAEMLIHGQSQRSAVDTFVAILITLSISGKLEKGVEESERKHQLAEQFAEELTKHIKERTEAEGNTGSDGNKNG